LANISDEGLAADPPSLRSIQLFRSSTQKSPRVLLRQTRSELVKISSFCSSGVNVNSSTNKGEDAPGAMSFSAGTLIVRSPESAS
jgi:hypothetical protein